MKSCFFNIFAGISFLLYPGTEKLIAQSVTVQTFSYTGATQTFVIPACASSLTVDLKGGSGGVSGEAWGGGAGGSLTVVITPTPGQLLYINVGRQGFTS